MPVNISHVDGPALCSHKHDLEPYLVDALGAHTTGHAWMNTSDLARRFQLPSFKDLPEAECLSYQWDIPRIERLIAEAVAKVQGFVPLPDLTVLAGDRSTAVQRR